MLDRDVEILKQIRIILEKDVFSKVNAASQEAAESVIKCVKLLESIEEKQLDIDERTDNTLDFANEHEPFVKNLIKQCTDKGLYTFIQLADDKCRNNIIAGSMPSEGIILNTIQTLVNVPEVLEPVLTGLGIPPDCAERCSSMRDIIERIKNDPDFKVEVSEKIEPNKD